MKNSGLKEVLAQTRQSLRLVVFGPLLLALIATACGTTKSNDVKSGDSSSVGANTAKGTNADSSPSPASVKPPSKAIAWELGNQLSLAALLYNARGIENTESLTKTKILASEFGAEVLPFPARTGDKVEDSAAIMAYLLNDGGKTIIGKVKEKYDQEHADLFEMALKSNLLLLMYGPGDKTGKTIAGVITRNGTRARLPESLWQPVVSKVEADASFDDVKTAVFKMQEDVRLHLNQR